MKKKLIWLLKEIFLRVYYFINLKLVFIAGGFVFLIILRKMVGTFGVSLGYLYVTLISLSALWFGIKGGLTAAVVSSLIFLTEVNLFKEWQYRDMVLNGTWLRLFVYFLGGLVVGYLSELEKDLKDKLQHLAYYDELTGCVNFSWTMRLLENALALSKRYNKKMTVVMLDIDHFKKINDEYGHLAGNDILKAFAGVIKNTVRNTDIVGRYGGEEFLIIFPEASAQKTLVVLERIKTKLRQNRITSEHLKKEAITINFSAGASNFPDNGDTVNDLISSADNALYQAKNSGRNRIFLERRSSVRIRPEAGLTFEIENAAGHSYTQALDVKNISRKGVLALFPGDMPSGNMPCRITFPDRRPPMKSRCSIVRKEKLADNVYRVGVSLEEPIPGIRKPGEGDATNGII